MIEVKRFQEKNSNIASWIGKSVAMGFMVSVMMNLAISGMTKSGTLEEERPAVLTNLYLNIYSVEVEDYYFIRTLDQEGITTIKKEQLKEVVYIDDKEHARLVEYDDNSSNIQWWGYKMRQTPEYVLYLDKETILEVQTKE